MDRGEAASAELGGATWQLPPLVPQVYKLLSLMQRLISDRLVLRAYATFPQLTTKFEQLAQDSRSYLAVHASSVVPNRRCTGAYSNHTG